MPELPPDAVLRYYRAISPEAFLDLLGYEITLEWQNPPEYRIRHLDSLDSPNRNLLEKYGFKTYPSVLTNTIYVTPTQEF